MGYAGAGLLLRDGTRNCLCKGHRLEDMTTWEGALSLNRQGWLLTRLCDPAFFAIRSILQSSQYA
jgi:hypothetical protein